MAQSSTSVRETVFVKRKERELLKMKLGPRILSALSAAEEGRPQNEVAGISRFSFPISAVY